MTSPSLGCLGLGGAVDLELSHPVAPWVHERRIGLVVALPVSPYDLFMSGACRLGYDGAAIVASY